MKPTSTFAQALAGGIGERGKDAAMIAAGRASGDRECLEGFPSRKSIPLRMVYLWLREQSQLGRVRSLLLRV